VPQPEVHLLVPVKSLTEAKSRLRGAADDGLGDPAAHARLALSLARDTVAAATAARLVRRVVVISPDPRVAAALGAGATVLGEGAGPGLNAALEHGADILRAEGWAGPLAAVQADLPALRPEELDAALDRALRLFAVSEVTHAFCADAAGTGTTLLMCAPSAPLRPRFGVGSAAAHAAMGAVRLDGPWPGLRRDVDTTDDLREAAALGLGPATSAVVGALPCLPR
jgi:2-phospho-L-lactate guanylyltransferase